MKKLIIALIIMCIGLVWLYRRGEQQILDSLEPDTLFAFVQDGCGHCHHALTHLDDTVRPTYPNLKIEVLNIRDSDNMAKLIVVAKHYHLDLDQLGTPVLLLNGHILLGWSDEYGKKLDKWIQAVPAKKDLTTTAK